MMSRLAQLFTLSATLCGLAAAAHANPLDAFGFGARGIALGGAMTALANDYSANYYNPAGLASDDKLRLEFGYIYVDPGLRINGGDQNVDRSYGVQGGLVMPGRIFGRNVAFSVALFLPAERISRIRALPQQQPRWVLYDNNPQRLVITTSVGFEVVPNLMLGVGLSYLSDTRGTLDMSGLVSIQDSEQTSLFSAVDVDLSAVRYPSAGLLWTPGEHARIGIGFRDRFSLDLDLGVNVAGDVAPLFPGEPPLVSDAAFNLLTTNTNLFSPRQLSAGFAWDGGRWLAVVDLTWAQWSQFDPPVSTIDIDLQLDPLDFVIPPGETIIDPDFHDILITRIGGEFDVVDSRHFGLTARAGYFWEPSPVPDQPGRTNYIDNDKHGGSLGLGFRFSEFSDVFTAPLLFDVAGQYIGIPERTYLKANPADAVGDYQAAGSFLGFSTSLSILF